MKLSKNSTCPSTLGSAASLHGDFIPGKGGTYRMRTIHSAKISKTRGSQDFLRR